MTTAAADPFDALMAEAERRPLEGWDLGYDGRIVSTPPWDFGAIVETQARGSPDLLDLGTGGGEWLSGLHCRPPRTVAVEGWAPNVDVARRRLGPLSVEVLAVEPAPPNVEQDAGAAGGALPFADGAFHLVTSRHEAYLPEEVRRVLAPGGTFLTQQVGSGVPADFLRLFGRPAPERPPAWNLAVAVGQLEAAGFAIDDARDGLESMTFADVGALAWYLKHMPCVDAAFALAVTRDELERLHRSSEGPLEVRQPLFRLMARKL